MDECSIDEISETYEISKEEVEKLLKI